MGICEPNANIWGKCFVFVCNSIVYQKRILKSVYVIKHRFIILSNNNILLSKVTENSLLLITAIFVSKSSSAAGRTEYRPVKARATLRKRFNRPTSSLSCSS